MGKNTGFLLCSFILLITSGCAIKEYTSPAEFYRLPPTEQTELCQKWSKTLNTGPPGRTYYSVVEPVSNREQYDMQSAYMNAAAANFGSALGAALVEKEQKRAKKNFSYCTKRHFTRNLPEGYSLFFLNKSRELEYIRSEVDQLNITATKQTLAGEYAKSLKLTKRALDIQENPYSYKIQGVTYILAAQNEKNGNKRRRFYSESIDSLTGSFNIQSFGQDIGQGPKFESASEYFLRGYAKHQINQNAGSFSDLDAPIFTSLPYYFWAESFLYKSLIICADSKVREKDNNDHKCNSKAGKQYGSYCRGFSDTELARTFSGSQPDSGPRKSWLKESLDDAEKICKGDKILQEQFSKRRLEMPSASFLKYLDQIIFRGFASN